jgi:hypothetical protein
MMADAKIPQAHVNSRRTNADSIARENSDILTLFKCISAATLVMIFLSGCKLFHQEQSSQEKATSTIASTSEDAFHVTTPEGGLVSDPPIGVANLSMKNSSQSHALLLEARLLLDTDTSDQKEEAEQKINKAIEMFPINCRARYQLARLLSVSGRFIEATDELELAMQVCYPYFKDIYTDDGFEKLRLSKFWKGYQQARSHCAEKWRRALSSPGVYLVVGVSDNDSGKDVLRSGALIFYHFETRRFLPLEASINVSGVVLDQQGDYICVVSVTEIQPLGQCIPSQFAKPLIKIFDLDNVTVSSHYSSSPCTSIAIYIEDTKPFVHASVYNEFDASEKWHTRALISGGQSIKKDPSPSTPCISNVLEKGEDWEKEVSAFCLSRLTSIPADDYLYIDGLCEDVYPDIFKDTPAPIDGDEWCAPLPDETMLCSKTSLGGTDTDLILSDAKGRQDTIATVDTVVQMIVSM